MQLVELQEAWPNLQKNGVATFAISYDSVEVLAAFADKRGITYPLLSDAGSHAIRALGLLNEQHLVEQHAFYGIQTRDEQRGVAYPGTFVLDERGIIAEKRFEQSYRVRPTARIFEEYALGTFEATRPPTDAPRQSGEKLEVQVWADAPTYRPYQQVRLHVDLSLPSGLHVFASPVADGFTPLRLEVEPLDGLEVGQTALPAALPFTVAGLGRLLRRLRRLHPRADPAAVHKESWGHRDYPTDRVSGVHSDYVFSACHAARGPDAEWTGPHS